MWASPQAPREPPGSPTEHSKASPSSSSRLPGLWLPVITGVKEPELLIFPEAFSKQQQPQQFSCKANKIPILLIQQDFKIVISWLCPLGKPQMIFHNVCVYVCETERKRLTDSTAHQGCLVFFKAPVSILALFAVLKDKALFVSSEAQPLQCCCHQSTVNLISASKGEFGQGTRSPSIGWRVVPPTLSQMPGSKDCKIPYIK